MTSAAEVADWMLRELKHVEYLYQEAAAYQIIERFGDEFVTINDLGNWAIAREVLKAFDTLTKEDVVWERGERLWRHRQEHDEPGREQA